MARPAFLVECLAEVLRRRFHGHDVVVDDEPDVLREQKSRIRLVLHYHSDTAEIARRMDDAGARSPSTAIGVLIDDPGGFDPILEAMAEEQRIDGILPLNIQLDVFLAGVELMIRGGEHFPSALLRRLKPGNGVAGIAGGTRGMAAISDPDDRPAAAGTQEARLTTREVEILDLLYKGTQNKLIAHRLKLSENTVKAHIRNIYRKLRVTNRTEAARRYFDEARDGGRRTTGAG
ncbi:response regulator transcription factor (plasmid) [Shinella sp. PSBB067]|uniref:helix-turn-helix transcriptional regulator n=1 Tax=Shinella sp. PSBB067 TaxID=2715959 RepID=UPI00193BCE8E|nr:response regulator transcription factor [Shinella sp. PSBB067]QRI66523.1 response regulator transcription factor [Shinella sp. PSBB067]